MKSQKTSTSTYYELLKDPRWQKKRLEVMNAAEFTCEVCGSTDRMLSIHHSYYEKGLKPWEYPSQSLHCLCDECHKNVQDFNALLQRQIGELDLTEHEIAYGYLLGLQMSSCPHVVAEVFSFEVAQGIADAWQIRPEQILDVLQDRKIDGWKLDELRKRSREAKKQTK